LPHLGSWEVGAVWAARHGFPLTTVAEPLEPPELYEWFVAQREKLGLRVLPLAARASTDLLTTLRRGELVALLADRDIVGDGVDVELFGERTRMPGGPAVLALRSGAPLIACAIFMRPRGRHFIVVRPPIAVERLGRLREDVARVTQQLACELEALVRLAPEQWHVFQPNWPADLPAAGQRAGPGVDAAPGPPGDAAPGPAGDVRAGRG
jgi:KDO2-lipid IV(A) lauroyltransferase